MTQHPLKPKPLGDDIPQLGSRAELRDLAELDHQSVISLIQELVRIPTRGGVDPYDPMIDRLSRWLIDHELYARTLRDTNTGQTVGIVCDIVGQHPGPRYVLDACLDTAPFGDPTTWRHEPTSGTIENNWLYGRGAADSKAAIAIFMHIAARMHNLAPQLHGALALLFDADEHTGHFGGAKCYFSDSRTAQDVNGVMIGYPGADQLVIGGRGFLRAEITVRGKAGHTGSRQRPVANGNAIEKAATIVQRFAKYSMPAPIDPALDLPPKLTVTKIVGGESYSITPDRCTIDVDVRLTTTFDEAAATNLITQITTQVDTELPSQGDSKIFFHESWPAYKLDDSTPIRLALTEAAKRHLQHPVQAKVAGPSNIGNYLARLGIDATAGLGVRYESLHDTNERIDLTSIPEVQATYHEAILALLGYPLNG